MAIGVPVPKAQFLKLRPGGDYGAYQRWIQAHNAARPPYNPLTAGYSTPQQLFGQAQQATQRTTQPLLDQITRSILAEQTAGANAIKGYTSTFLDRISGMPNAVRDIYSQAEQSQSTINEGLSSLLSGQGSEAQAGLAAKLAEINAPSESQQYAQNAGALGQNAAGTTAAVGANSLARLISEGAQAQSYAAAQPGIGVLSGQQQLGQFEQGLAARQTTLLGDIASKTPGYTQDLYTKLLDQDLQRALGQQAYGLNVAKTKAYVAHQTTMEELAQQGLDIRRGSAAERANNNRVRNAISLAKLTGATKITIDGKTYKITPTTSPEGQKLVPEQRSAIKDARVYAISLGNKKTPAGESAPLPPVLSAYQHIFSILSTVFDAKKARRYALLSLGTVYDQSVLKHFKPQ